ncbi:hypothetical protein [Haloarcula laminariae]|uniref:hypothetical protein n=1 Tax=Haloarcula laminariae TaxID=2961577 RepID=UPI0021C7BA29|nr:hypothetical protein [Halomicroarcula laminariae]
MNRRKFLIGAGSLAAGSAAAMGTGAFTSVSANRTVSVNTASDANAFLALNTSEGGENSDYVQTGGGQVNIQLSSSNNYNEDASGVNQDGITRILDLFDVENQGTQNVFVYANSVSDGDLFVDPQASDRPTTPEETDSNYGTGEPNNAAQISDEISLSGRGNQVNGNFPEDDLKGYNYQSYILEPGESFAFGLYINGGTDDTASISTPITINAVADYEDFSSINQG